jgi:hypothetical protein
MEHLNVAYFEYLFKPVNIKIYRTIILYGCETWSLTLWEENMLRVFYNMVLRRVFGSESEEVAGEDCVMRSFTTFMHLSMLLG